MTRIDRSPARAVAPTAAPPAPAGPALTRRETEKLSPPARDFGAIQGAAPVRFTPAAAAPYECTIHTLQMKGSDGRPYNVVLDLIRSDENKLWGVSQDRTALRAVVSDAATGEVVASRFVDAPRRDFQEKVGDLGIMDGQGDIRFASADGQMAFDLGVKIEPSTLAQKAGDTLKAQVEKAISRLPPDQQRKVMEHFPLQLLVTDYPKTRHTGTMTVQVPGRDQPLTLTADDTPSTVSHHFGNSLTDYVFLASVPKAGEPSFIAVVTREQVDLDPSKPGGEVSFPFGYLIRTDAQGKSTFQLLTPDADKGRRAGEFDIGSDFLGTDIDVKVKHEAGEVVLNDGQLPARTAFGEATIGSWLGKSQHFSDVVVDVTGSFLKETGRDGR